jgi:UbiD family decarboxylase
MQQHARTRAALPDTEAFRLRGFVERLAEAGMLDDVAEKTPLNAMAARLDENPRAVRFRAAGPEAAEVVGNVMGSGDRIALAFGVSRGEMSAEVMRRLADPQPVVEIPSADAPVHRTVLEGDAADLTRLPVHLQHEKDGGPYISAAIDYSVDPHTGHRNVGVRRLMLRGPRETGVDMVAPSDLQAIYRKPSAAGERLPISFVIGAHPTDYVAAAARVPTDELALVAAMRGAPLPVVRCVTNDLLVPADAEMVLEGYLDGRGWYEPEGPYGEYLGYYGVMKTNPVFRLTAICARRDALFQTVTISGRRLDRTETANLGTVRTEVGVWNALRSAVREPVAVFATASSGGTFNVRVALRQRVPGEARNAIAAVFGTIENVKHVFVVDEDIDVGSDAQIDWALSTRFQADRDLVVAGGFRAMPLDPSLGGSRTGAKAGFDLTLPFGARDRLDLSVPAPPKPSGPARFRTVRAALEAGPLFFGEIVAAMGSDDGREAVREMHALREEGVLGRTEEGRYALTVKESP